MAAPIDASLAGSASAGAALSGATDQGGSTTYGNGYGPGALIFTDQRGSIGAAAGGSSLLVWVVAAAAVAFAAFSYFRKK